MKLALRSIGPPCAIPWWSGFYCCLAIWALGALAGTASPPSHADEPAVVHWQDAERVVGQTAFVVGRVARVGHAKSVHFLNFHTSARDHFTVVIFKENLRRFSQTLEQLYDARVVKVRGPVTRYRGVPQIKITGPEQIEILAEMPAHLTDLTRPTTEPVATSMATMSVATMNVRNLFDDQDDPYAEDESTPTKSRKELSALAKTLRALDADVVALQEVESRGYLQRFVDKFLLDLNYEVVHFEGNDERGIDVAVLSRLPVGRVTSNRHQEFVGANGKPQRFCRDILQVELLPPGQARCEIWAVHLKSNAEGAQSAAPIRLAEIDRLRAIYNETLARDPQALVLLAGDFNDHWTSRSIQRLMDGTTPPLVAFIAELPPAERITYHPKPYRSMIDFLLASPALAQRYQVGSYYVLTSEVAQSASDHFPVRAVFDMSR